MGVASSEERGLAQNFAEFRIVEKRGVWIALEVV